MSSILRLTHTAESENKYRVEVAFEGDGLPRQTATARFEFKLTGQDQEDIRWYLEDFLQYPLDPAPKMAARIENRMNEIGAKLFKDIFQSGDDARDLWATLRPRLDDTRVEIITEVREAAAIPWELIRDPKTDTALSLRAHSFVRAHSQAAERPKIPDKTATGPIRILLVICRPGGSDDVPFRSVASRLIKGLSESELFQLDVLRPPTFEQLARVLRAAKDGGQPYHVIHFDGHGVYADVSPGNMSALLSNLSHLLLSGPRAGAHGYLLFENPSDEENAQLVDGSSLGKLLVETRVPVLVLNACRSAHADPPPEPVAAEAAEDPHAKVRAFGSFAHEVMDTGVAGVVAMRYNVYVVTAAQFVAELYASLTQGHKLGDAVTIGRKQLAAQPFREIAYDPLPLQDWPVPVVYEAAPIALFPKASAEKKLNIKLSEAEATPSRGTLDAKLPPSPDAGFFGRDETLLALDRAFDTQSIVLLHAYAGNGKTSTVAEFARWYALTGGVDGPVLFTSFEQYKPLARVLDQIEQMFGPMLEQQAGINWLALTDDQRREVALQVLKQIPVLWIWDNVEPVAGFPAGAQSSWSAAEQRELADFLRAARGTKAKFLLTSRRDEKDWLGDLPARVTLPWMPMQERVQLARALADKYGRRLIDVDDWRPLLEFTRGNPMSVTVLVGQALRDGLKTKEQIEAFVGKLRAGESVFEDEESEGRSKSLGASLSYGFDTAFSEEERKQLALLHFFQGFVDVYALCLMGNPDIGDLPEVRGLTREAGIALLARAAEIGLLTAHGNGYYSIHPAVPWFFKRLFDLYYPAPSNAKSARSVEASRAFVEAMGNLGNFYANQYIGGNSNVIGALTAEESNMLYARHLARAQGWWANVIDTMQGLNALYGHTGRVGEWARLVNEIVPDFVDPDTDGPMPEKEDEWSLVTEYRVLLAEEARQWSEAERLQRLRVDWSRQRAARALTIPQKELDDKQRYYLRTLASSLHELGEIQRELDQPECVESYEESLKLAERIGERYGVATCAFNLGNAYLYISALHDFAQAERWYRRSLEMYDEHQPLAKAHSLGQLGAVSYKRFLEAREAEQPEEELLRHLNNALQFYNQALELTPSDAVIELSAIHNQLGIIYKEAGDLGRALLHYREAIRYHEIRGDIFAAAQTRRNVAILLVQADRLADAREYTYAALRNFETYGDRATEEIQKTRKLIAYIEQLMQAQGG